MTNIKSAALFMAFGFLLAGSPAQAQQREYVPAYPKATAPEAADQTLGMALMSAVVDLNGGLVRGAGVTNVEKVTDPGTDTGHYTVSFNRNITNCTCTASAGYGFLASWTSGVLAVANCPYTADSVRVTTFSAWDTQFEDNPFQLIVFCPK